MFADSGLLGSSFMLFDPQNQAWTAILCYTAHHVTRSMCMAAGLQTCARHHNRLLAWTQSHVPEHIFLRLHSQEYCMDQWRRRADKVPSTRVSSVPTPSLFAATATQVTFHTISEGTQAERLQSPVWLQMHGSDGVNPPVQFEPMQEDGVAVYERNLEACGELSHLTVWLTPIAVSCLLSHAHCCEQPAVSQVY